MVSLCGAITIDNIQKISFRIQTLLKLVKTNGLHYLERTAFIMFSILTLSSLIGISRIISLYVNYQAPMDLSMEVNRLPLTQNYPPDMQIEVCFGKDWYRYSSSFFLPNNKWNVRFIKSDFNGMLPAPYNSKNSTDDPTKIIHDYFNDQNKADERSYFDIEKCHYLIDLDVDEVGSELEPNYSSQTQNWVVVKSLPFINARKSHPFFRAFYIPYLSNVYCKFNNFNLLKSTKYKFL